jgi:hypothetical protein
MVEKKYDNEKDMVLTVTLDYRKTWDRSAAEILRKCKTWDYETLRKMQAIVNDVHSKYWERKGKQKKQENDLFEDVE